MSNETTPPQEETTTTIGSIGKLAGALAKAQGAFETPTKSKEAKVEKEGRLLYKYKYSDLDDLIKATRPALAANGIAVLQNVHSKQGAVGVTTILAHESGQLWSSDILWIPVVGSKPQDYGIAETYARRYSMSAALNVAAEDDLDANMREHEKNENAPRRVRLPDEKPQEAPQSAPKSQPAAKPEKDQKSSPATAGTAYKGESGEIEYVNKQKVKRMFGIAQVHSVSVEAMKKYLGAMTPPITSSDHIPVTLYDKIVSDIQEGKVK